jgi:hypothetical protein
MPTPPKTKIKINPPPTLPPQDDKGCKLTTVRVPDTEYYLVSCKNTAAKVNADS